MKWVNDRSLASNANYRNVFAIPVQNRAKLLQTKSACVATFELPGYLP